MTKLAWPLLLLLLPVSVARAQEEEGGPELWPTLMFLAQTDAPPAPPLRVPALGATLTGGARVDVDPATGFGSITDVDLPPREDGTLGLARTTGVLRWRGGLFGRGTRSDVDARVRISMDGRFVTVERPEGVTLFSGDDERSRWSAVSGPHAERLARTADGWRLEGGPRQWSFYPDGTIRSVEPGFTLERSNPARMRLRAPDGEAVVIDLDDDGRAVRVRRGDLDLAYRYRQGRLVEVSGSATRRLEHDARGRVTRVETPDDAVTLTHDQDQRLTSLEHAGRRRTYGGRSQPGSRMVERMEGDDEAGSTWTAVLGPDGWTVTGPDGVALRVDARGRALGGPTAEAPRPPGGGAPRTTTRRRGLVARLEGLGAPE